MIHILRYWAIEKEQVEEYQNSSNNVKKLIDEILTHSITFLVWDKKKVEIYNHNITKHICIVLMSECEADRNETFMNVFLSKQRIFFYLKSTLRIPCKCF